MIVGDAKNGKKGLIEKLCADKNLSQKVEVLMMIKNIFQIQIMKEEDELELAKNSEIKAAQKVLLTYDYFYIDDEDDTTDDSRVNVWSANSHMFEQIHDIVGDANKDERVNSLYTIHISYVFR